MASRGPAPEVIRSPRGALGAGIADAGGEATVITERTLNPTSDNVEHGLANILDLHHARAVGPDRTASFHPRIRCRAFS